MMGVKDTKTIVNFLDTKFFKNTNTCKAIEPYYKITRYVDIGCYSHKDIMGMLITLI